MPTTRRKASPSGGDCFTRGWGQAEAPRGLGSELMNASPVGIALWFTSSDRGEHAHFDLSDVEWELIQPLLPSKPRRGAGE